MGVEERVSGERKKHQSEAEVGALFRVQGIRVCLQDQEPGSSGGEEWAITK